MKFIFELFEELIHDIFVFMRIM